MSVDCEGSDCREQSTVDGTESSMLALGVEVLMRALPGLYLGLGSLVVPRTELDLDSVGAIRKVGTDASLSAIALMPTGSLMGLDTAVRAQGGLQILLPGDDLEDHKGDLRHRCADCQVSDDPGLGWNLAAGGTASFEALSLPVRTTLLVQYLTVDMVQVDFPGAEQTTTWSGYRIWLLVGTGI